MGLRQDKRGWTHIDWELEGVTPKMIDWFWSNMEKGFVLWHPAEHTDFYWLKKPSRKEFIGAIHVAPQVWSDGRPFLPHIRFDDVAGLPDDVKEVVVYSHVVAAVGISLTGENVKEDDPPLAYRIHQWEATDAGVRGMSSAIPAAPDPMETERGLIWAKHAAEEVAHWQDFLPELYRLWSVVKNPEVNLFFSLKVIRDGKSLLYEEMHKRARGTG
jgi:hypothetical protein